jgi:SAM-dependent methyltransferase
MNCPFLTQDQLNEPEVFYPLKLYVCEKCWLVQIDEFKRAADIFNSDYAYFSSYSKSWLEHCREYVDMITERLGLNETSLAVEVASNDGYLLQYFKDKQIPTLGIEPTENTAQAAIGKGIETICDFFTETMAKKLASQGKTADLVIGNNVLAHVPDINGFVEGLKIALKPDGVITMEFPHLMQLVGNRQFDTIYHEHFSYISFHSAKTVFAAHGLELFDVEEIPTHGGSLRIYARHTNSSSEPICNRVEQLLEKEKQAGMLKLSYYQAFQHSINNVKNDLMSFLVEQKRKGKLVAGYGAAAKGNTLLNYCGIKKDLLAFVVDKSPHKQGKFLPGSHIPVAREEAIEKAKPDFILILPWNLKKEITDQLDYIRNWGGQFVVAIPNLAFG